MSKSGPGRSLAHDIRVLLLALGAGSPGVLVALTLLWYGSYSPKIQWTLTLAVVGSWLALSFALRQQVVRPLQTLANLLGALREGDYSIRARGSTGSDALGLATTEINALGETLRSQRLGAVEATALLGTVMAGIEVAVFCFDGEGRLQLSNRAGELLLGVPATRLTGRTAKELGMENCLVGDSPRTLETAFPGGSGPWELRRTRIRQEGLQHQLVAISDLSRALREEERMAWQRLVRVLGHEINNSLTPIKSIANSLQNLLEVEPRPDDCEDDLKSGLSIIAGRSEALARFMTSYSQLARLPSPRFAPVDVGGWVRRVAALEERTEVFVKPGPEVTLLGDGDQLDQLLINLVKNAAEAARETGGDVSIEWQERTDHVEVLVIDSGPGLEGTQNLFVPFFTTKSEGSGIGLVLSRQIAEAHHGALSLTNRTDTTGCIARLRLPLSRAARRSSD